jgi:aminopeptidase N
MCTRTSVRFSCRASSVWLVSSFLCIGTEPFYAHHFLPCFDQPDLRAKLDLKVVAPSDWKVVANGKTTQSSHVADGHSEHVFETTPAISTYLFALVAGPYDHVTDDFKGRVPLGIYCRKSLRKYLDSEELFEITKQGMAFYEEFFAMEFPFSKYDQLFVPEFNQGSFRHVCFSRRSRFT